VRLPPILDSFLAWARSGGDAHANWEIERYQAKFLADALEAAEKELTRAWGVAEHFADQLMENWHETGKEETREAHEYMGLSFAAYSRYVHNIRLMSVPRRSREEGEHADQTAR